MLAARRILITLAALFAASYAQNKCGSATAGMTNGTPINLKEALMAPGTSDFNVDVPNVCPAPSERVGARVTACDDDVAPLVVTYDPSHAHVHRQGSLANEGKIYVIVYCGALNERSRFELQAKPHQKYDVHNAYDVLRPRVNGVLGPSNVYDSITYRVPQVHGYGSSGELGLFEAPRTYDEGSTVDAAQAYMPPYYAVPKVVPLRQ